MRQLLGSDWSFSKLRSDDMEQMLCCQCEQSVGPDGCTVAGNCGKDARTAALQDLVLHACKAVSVYAHRARVMGVVDNNVDMAVVEGLFATVTNVNFDPDRLAKLIDRLDRARTVAKGLYEKACQASSKAIESTNGATRWVPAADLEGLVKQGQSVGLRDRLVRHGKDITALRELLLYGVKGTAAYADHAHILGRDSNDIYGFFHEALAVLDGEKHEVQDLLDLCMKCGEVNLGVMALLDSAHTQTYGNPVPTPVRIEPIRGKAIVVSGHDLKDLAALLEQTEGKGINVYTHGEMLPAHGYPELRKHKHLVGNYGGAWQDQVSEFDQFPGAVLMTTNCIQRPRESYKNRIFTSGLVAYPGVRHIEGQDFGPVIDAALAAPGFDVDGSDRTILTGFGHHAVLSVADKIIDAVKAGKIRRFFLVGGCDGAKTGRNYYTELAQAIPDDCVILTLACGKYRFNKLEFGDIEGIPRLLDMGQCNDAYSAIQVAVALANAFKTDVNGLPLSLILSWYEQKAVAVLLTLLHLGIKDIRLGPSLPTFVSPAVLGVLVEKFGLKPISKANDDLAAMLK